MSEHTPGPWGVLGLSDGSLVITSPTGTIGEVDERPEDEVNARLIAAAPDLLAVLEQIVADVEDVDSFGNLDRFYDRMVANAEDATRAISKALDKE